MSSLEAVECVGGDVGREDKENVKSMQLEFDSPKKRKAIWTSGKVDDKLGNYVLEVRLRNAKVKSDPAMSESVTHVLQHCLYAIKPLAEETTLNVDKLAKPVGICDEDWKIFTESVAAFRVCPYGAAAMDFSKRPSLPPLFYKPSDEGPLSQSLTADDASEDAVIGAQLWQLPSTLLDHLWQTLYFESDRKDKLFRYASGLIRLSECGLSPGTHDINRLILLYGPPGTGKTSLCKALAQRLSIRLTSRFPRTVLFEINSHSLFSKWFSESGKLVHRLFEQIEELAGDSKCLVTVLIDEVESLAMSREAAVARNEPVDAVRAVNAMLTQIDNIRRHPNVLVLMTSNMCGCLDAALADRVGYTQHIPLPGANVIERILDECADDLVRTGVVDVREAVDSSKLADLAATLADRFSARALRQLPIAALVNCTSFGWEGKVSYADYVRGLEEAARETLTLKMQGKDIV